MIVVADASPLRYLILIEHTHILQALYGRVLIQRVLADAAEHDLADLPTAFDRLRQTNFRASEALLNTLLARDAARREAP